MNENINHLMNLRPYEDKEKIQEFLNNKSNEDLFELFAHIVDNKPSRHKSAIEIIINRLYSDEDQFVSLICKLIENTSSPSGLAFGKIPIEEIALRQQEKTLAIAKKAINFGIRPGICSGIIISPLLTRGIVDEDVIFNLESEPILQRHFLVAICNSFIRKDEAAFKLFITKLIEVAENVDQDNTDILIQCLISAFLIDKDSVLHILEREIEQRGYIAANTYIRTTQYLKDFPISLLKKAFQIIEAETPENKMVDVALAQIYEEDQSFVVERLRDRLRKGDIVGLMGRMLIYSIKESGPSPVIQMLEEEIDNENPTMIHIGGSILNDFLPSEQERLGWCKNWKDDKRKEIVVLQSLAEILTDLMNYQPSQVRDDAVTLVKEFAEKKGLDYNEETKGINLGKDSRDGAEYKENTIKALYIIDQIFHPPIQIDTEVLKKNLKNYPYLSKAIGAEWLVKSAKSKSPHPLTYIYSRQYNALSYAALEQLYWEQVFKTLNDHNLKIPQSKKLRDQDNAESFLVEAEVIARLAPHFKVELEPDVKEFEPNELDARIEFKGQQALIEVAVVKERIELDIARGGISLPGGKVKSVLLTKFKKQLKEGKADPKVPVILVLYLYNVLDGYEVENAIYGQLKFQWKTRRDTGQVVENGAFRDENSSFYEVENSDIVTTIGAYKRDYGKKDPLIGKLYRPPHQIVPRNPLSREFRLKLRNALFGASENSSWQSLLKIEGIDENMAKKLHANGIEDLEILAIATDEELQIEDFDAEQLKEFQKEAKRIVSALSTDSIKFLRGSDQSTSNLLTKRGIYLIDQMIKLTELPEGVDSLTWGKMMDDAKRISSNNNQENAIINK